MSEERTIIANLLLSSFFNFYSDIFFLTNTILVSSFKTKLIFTSFRSINFIYITCIFVITSPFLSTALTYFKASASSNLSSTLSVNSFTAITGLSFSLIVGFSMTVTLIVKSRLLRQNRLHYK